MFCLEDKADEILREKLSNMTTVPVVPDSRGFVLKNERIPAIVVKYGAQYEPKIENCTRMEYELKTNIYLNSSSFSTESKRFSQLMMNGIPDALRLKVYKKLLDVHGENDYEELLLLPQETSILLQIAKDLDRTMPNKYFLRESEIQAQLFRILVAFSATSQLRYIEGMSIPAARFVELAEEKIAFRLFSAYMERIGGVFDIRIGLQQIIGRLHQIVLDKLPELYAYLDNMLIDFEMFAPEWFMSMFSRSTPHRLFERIFDLIVYRGEDAMIAVALQLLSVAAKGSIFIHTYGPDDPQHIEEFERFYEQLGVKERRAGISCLGMPSADCLDWIQNVGKSITDIDEFIFDAMAFLE